MGRERVIRFRVNDAERALFDALAEHYGAPISTVVRMLAKRDATALGKAPRGKAGQGQARQGR